MPTFKIKSEVTVTYTHDVEADTLEEAIAMVEDGEDDGAETDSSAPIAQYYAVDGRMGWTFIERDENDAPIISEDEA